jgi:hypothetical protein
MSDELKRQVLDVLLAELDGEEGESEQWWWLKIIEIAEAYLRM